MEDSSDGQPGGSGITDLRTLIQKTKEKYKRMFPNDPQWPCPFCIVKLKTKVECNVHISKDHASIIKHDREHFFSQFCSDTIETDSNVCNRSEGNGPNSNATSREQLPRKCKTSKHNATQDKTPNAFIEFLKAVETSYPEFNELSVLSNNEYNFICEFCPTDKQKRFKSGRGLNIDIDRFFV